MKKLIKKKFGSYFFNSYTKLYKYIKQIMWTIELINDKKLDFLKKKIYSIWKLN